MIPGRYPTHGDGIMKLIVPLLMLTSMIGPHAIASDSQEARRNALAICNQFVIEDPGSAIYLNDLEDRSFFQNHVRNCHVDIWDGIR
jgi:hypothetical protein